MKIEKEKFVALSYTLNVDGKVADQATKDSPLKFVYGLGFLLPKFEDHLDGLSVGDKFAFTLSPEDGYGVTNEQMVLELPKEIFEIEGETPADLLVVDNLIPMMAQNGQQLIGKVLAVVDNSVTMDFNHPMADKVLNFEGEIVEVRDAVDEDYPNDCGGCNCHGEEPCDCDCDCSEGNECTCDCSEGDECNCDCDCDGCQEGADCDCDSEKECK